MKDNIKMLRRVIVMSCRFQLNAAEPVQLWRICHIRRLLCVCESMQYDSNVHSLSDVFGKAVVTVMRKAQIQNRLRIYTI